MSVTVAFCSTCQREVHLAQDEALTCPVCSAGLVPALRAAFSKHEEVPAQAVLG